LQQLRELGLAMDLPRQQAARASFRAMPPEQKQEVLSLIYRADSLHALLVRMFLDDLLREREQQ